MIEQTVEIRNPHGLHARPAARFVATTARFESVVRVASGKQVVNGRSIMGLLVLAARAGSSIRIIVDGPDEQKALSALVALVEAQFEPAKPDAPAAPPGEH